MKVPRSFEKGIGARTAEVFPRSSSSNPVEMHYSHVDKLLTCVCQHGLLLIRGLFGTGSCSQRGLRRDACSRQAPCRVVSRALRVDVGSAARVSARAGIDEH